MFTIRDILQGRVKVISDTHFGHANIVYMSGRPGVEKHDSGYHNTLMRNRWYESVGPDDWVLHIGDVGASPEAIHKHCADLPGKVVVVPGNHDGGKYNDAMREIGWKVLDPLECFSIVMPEYDVFICHKPMEFVKQKSDRVQINLCGHTHTQDPPTMQHMNCSVEQPHIDYRPVDILPIMQMAYERAQTMKNGGRQRFQTSGRKFPAMYHPGVTHA